MWCTIVAVSVVLVHKVSAFQNVTVMCMNKYLSNRIQSTHHFFLISSSIRPVLHEMAAPEKRVRSVYLSRGGGMGP